MCLASAPLNNEHKTPGREASYARLQDVLFPLQLEDGKQVLDCDPNRSYPGLQENVHLASVEFPEQVILPCHGGSISTQG